MGEQTILIDRRFRGPPESGNGGYVAGMLAKSLGGSNVEVTLRAPPPLDTPLRLISRDDGAELMSGDALIASAVRTAVELEVPPPPTLSQAKEAEARFSGFDQHNFPGCFVCGPERGVGDGLRIFPGATDLEKEQVAGIWTPDPSLNDDGGRLVVEHVWAALDCAGYFAVRERAGIAVLGRIAARVARVPIIGEPTIVTGWTVASEGRKHRTGTALHDRNGILLAMAAATWLTIG